MTTRPSPRLCLPFDACVDVSKQCKAVHGRGADFRLAPAQPRFGDFDERGDGIAGAGHRPQTKRLLFAPPLFFFFSPLRACFSKARVTSEFFSPGRLNAAH